MPKKSDDEKPEAEETDQEQSPKGDKRQFQVAPGQHEHLTKAEAKKKGFHWHD